MGIGSSWYREGLSFLQIPRSLVGRSSGHWMGVDVRDLTCAVNIGIPKNAWKMKQQSGRLGRNGEQSVDVTIVFPQKGASAPESKLRGAIKGSSCIRSAMNKLFVLKLSSFSIFPIIVDETIETLETSFLRAM